MDVGKALKIVTTIFGFIIVAIGYKLLVFDRLLPLVNNVFLQWLLGISIGIGLLVGVAVGLAKLFSVSVTIE